MSEIHETLRVDAAVERVVAFLDSPENFALLDPRVARIVDVKRMAGRVGTTFRVIYKTRGVTFEESVLVSRFGVPPRTTPHRRYQTAWSFQGLVQGSSVWTLEALDNQTEVGLDVEYQLAAGVVGSVVDWLFARRENDESARQMLANMKRELATGLPLVMSSL